MTLAWRLFPTTRFKRDVSRIHSGDPGIIPVLESAEQILRRDPYNLCRRYEIKKLRDVPAGEGQYRIRLGIFRLRYDIIGDQVILYSFKHRRESY
jgi:mRNA-degrading endonuclease RelE of RelBE toxin-antitoxin system